MYVISQLLSRIGTLMKVGTPEQGDTITRLSNTYLGPMPFPHLNPTASTDTMSDSFNTLLQASITNNGAGLVTTGPTLVPGIWELTFMIDSEFNWLNANPIAQDNRLVLTLQNVLNLELWSSSAKVSRVVMKYGALRFTLKDQHTLRLIQNGNGVGQTSNFNVAVHGNRLL